MLARLNTVAEKDYAGASLEQALDRLLRGHHERVMLGAAAALARNETSPTDAGTA